MYDNPQIFYSLYPFVILRTFFSESAQERASIQITCNWLGDSMGTEPVSKQAFSQARHRLSYTAFEAMHADGNKGQLFHGSKRRPLERIPHYCL